MASVKARSQRSEFEDAFDLWHGYLRRYCFDRVRYRSRSKTRLAVLITTTTASQEGDDWRILTGLAFFQVINSRSELGTSQHTENDVTVIQMTVPAWFPAQMIHHLHRRRKRSKPPLLVSSPSCSDTSNYILRDNSKLVDEYYDLPSNPAAVLSLPSNRCELINQLSFEWTI